MKIGEFVTPVQSILLHEADGIFIVTVLLPDVNPEFASKNTFVEEVGNVVCWVAPPDAVTQCVRSFQLPEPPTQ